MHGPFGQSITCSFSEVRCSSPLNESFPIVSYLVDKIVIWFQFLTRPGLCFSQWLHAESLNGLCCWVVVISQISACHKSIMLFWLCASCFSVGPFVISCWLVAYYVPSSSLGCAFTSLALMNIWCVYKSFCVYNIYILDFFLIFLLFWRLCF